MLDKLSFEVVESPIFYKGSDIYTPDLEIKGYKAITKDTGGVISVMKSSYNPMLNEHFMETTERMGEISGFKFSGYSEIDGGRIILSHLKNDMENFTIGGHKIEDYLVLGSSFDGRYPFFIGTSTVLLRCKNQFSKLSRVEKVRHTKSSPKKRDELMKGLEIYFATRRKMYQNFEQMIQVEVDPILKQKALDYVLSISEEDRLGDNISTRKQNQLNLLSSLVDFESGELGQNMWACLNGVSKYTTHHMESKNESFGNLFGTKAEINNRIYEYATSLF